MTSLVNTDIPATFFLVLSVLIMNLAIHRKKLFPVILAGLVFSFCTFVRGAMLVYLPTLFIMLFLTKKKTYPKQYKFLAAMVLLASFLVTGFTLDTAINNVPTEGVTIDESRYLMWPLIKGMNIEKLGRDNHNDSRLVSSWPAEDVNRLGIQEIKDRLFPDPIAFYKILDDKFEYLLANGTYTAYIAFLDETNENRYFETGWNAPTLQIRKNFAQLSQYAYLSILLLALSTVLKTNQQQAFLWVPSFIILLCALGAYTFFEVQPRYSFPLIPFLNLLAGMAFIKKESLQPEQ